MITYHKLVISSGLLSQILLFKLFNFFILPFCNIFLHFFCSWTLLKLSCHKRKEKRRKRKKKKKPKRKKRKKKKKNVISTEAGGRPSGKGDLSVKQAGGVPEVTEMD